jgi:hypothetical protein
MQISYIPPDRIFLGGLITYMIGVFEHLLPKFRKKVGAHQAWGRGAPTRGADWTGNQTNQSVKSWGVPGDC